MTGLYCTRFSSQSVYFNNVYSKKKYKPNRNRTASSKPWVTIFRLIVAALQGFVNTSGVSQTNPHRQCEASFSFRPFSSCLSLPFSSRTHPSQSGVRTSPFYPKTCGNLALQTIVLMCFS